jgi:hypothetical protein
LGVSEAGASGVADGLSAPLWGERDRDGLRRPHLDCGDGDLGIR